MTARLAWLLDAANIRNLCFLYFLVAPVFLDRTNAKAILILFALGYLISLVIVGLAAGETLSRLSHVIRYRPLSLLVVALVVMSLLSVLINTPGNILKPSLIYFKYGKLVLPALVFFVMVNIWDRRDIPKLSNLLLSFGLLTLLVSVLEVGIGLRVGWVARLGTLVTGDSNKYAVVLNILYGFLLAEFIARKLKGLPRQGLGFLIIVIAGGVLLTQSRGGMLAFLAITLTCLAASRSWRMVRWGGMIMVPFVLLAVLVALYRYTLPASAQLSDLGRVWTYIVAWNAIQDNPFFGIGFGNTALMYEAYGQGYDMLMGRQMDVHNIILEIFAQQGLAGLIVFLLFTFIPMGLLIKRIRVISRTRYPVEEVAALLIPLAFFLYGMISHQYIAHEFFWAYMAFTMIVVRSADPPETPSLFGLSQSSARR